MSKSRPQYTIRATRKCRTHRAGTRLTYTGPRRGILAGWTVESGPRWPEYGGGTV